MQARTKPTIQVARKVLEVVSYGLCSGVGNPIPGQMCVEAAVCYAMGEPHGDKPTCVGEAVRNFKINLNDQQWSSKGARAAGMRKIAIAQLGSDSIDQVEFAKQIALKTVKVIVPIALRAAAALIPSHSGSLGAAAKTCEAAFDLVSAHAAGRAAGAAGYAAGAAGHAADCAADAADAADYAAGAADAAGRAAGAAGRAAGAAGRAAGAAGRAAGYAAGRAAGYAAGRAAGAADRAAGAADRAAGAAAYAAGAADYAAGAAGYAAGRAAGAAGYAAGYAVDAAGRDKVLHVAADLGVEVLKELKCPGTRWLYLCKE